MPNVYPESVLHNFLPLVYDIDHESDEKIIPTYYYKCYGS